MNLDKFIDLALEEDLGDGDHTSLACIPSDAEGKAKLLVKDNGILAGVEVARAVFSKVDPELCFQVLIEDGTKVEYGNIAFYVSGSSQSILKGERLALNLMQRMSGIATFTNTVANKLDGLKTKVLDTRKTTPNLRSFEKEAVKIGGGTNHRFGLYDMMMIKDNHIDYAGGIKEAIEAAVNYNKESGKFLKIEIEARDLKEVETILSVGQVDRIMLDNFNYEDMRTAVKMIGDDYETEASGGINLDTVRLYAECGVDYVSMGALTHTVKNFDLSLKAV